MLVSLEAKFETCAWHDSLNCTQKLQTSIPPSWKLASHEFDCAIMEIGLGEFDCAMVESGLLVEFCASDERHVTSLCAKACEFVCEFFRARVTRCSCFFESRHATQSIHHPLDKLTAAHLIGDAARRVGMLSRLVLFIAFYVT